MKVTFRKVGFVKLVKLNYITISKNVPCISLSKAQKLWPEVSGMSLSNINHLPPPLVCNCIEEVPNKGKKSV